MSTHAWERLFLYVMSKQKGLFYLICPLTLSVSPRQPLRKVTAMNPTSKMGISPHRTPPITLAPLWSSPATPATLWNRAQLSLSVSMCVTRTGMTRNLYAEVRQHLPQGQNARGLHPSKEQDPSLEGVATLYSGFKIRLFPDQWSSGSGCCWFLG